MKRPQIRRIHCVVPQGHEHNVEIDAEVDEDVEVPVIAYVVSEHLFAVSRRLLLRHHFDPDHLLVFFYPQPLVARHQQISEHFVPKSVEFVDYDTDEEVEYEDIADYDEGDKEDGRERGVVLFGLLVYAAAVHCFVHHAQPAFRRNYFAKKW